jgi:hypothetical protein
VEGSDATNQIRDAIVDDATRIDATALNTLSGHDPGGQIAAQSDVTGLSIPTTVQIRTEIDNNSTQLEAIREKVDAISVTGANTVTISIIDTNGAAIPDVSVQIWNNDLNALITYGTSNSVGQVVVALDDATYKVKLKKAGYKFIVPETLIVSGDTEDSYTGTSLFFLADVSGSTLTTRVYEFCMLPGDVPVDSVSAYATITSLPEDNGSALFTGQKIEGIYNKEHGVVYWDIIKGANVRFVIANFGINISRTIPSTQDVVRLTDIEE